MLFFARDRPPGRSLSPRSPDAPQSRPPPPASPPSRAAAPADASALTKQLRAGLDYELSKGCPNAKGKAFSDFQQFLCARLGELEAATPPGELAAALANIHGDAVSYAAMPPEGRDALLRRLGSTLYQSQRTAAAPSAAPKPWSPPAPPNPAAASGARGQRANSAVQRRSALAPTDHARRSRWAPEAGDGGAEGVPTVGEAPTPRASPAPRAAAAEIPVVIVFDLETTGLSKDRNRIIEIAAVNVNDPTHAPVSTLVNPGRFLIPPPIVALTGITNSAVSAPAVPSFARAAELLEAFVEEARRRAGGASVLLAAHNARQFDAGFLQAEYRRIGRELPDDWRFVDTLPLARKMLDKNVVGSFKLETLAHHFGVGPREGEVAHRAKADARMLGDVLCKGILGVDLEGSAGASFASVENENGGDEDALRSDALLAAAAAMASHSFSLGDPSKNRLGRALGELTAPPRPVSDPFAAPSALGRSFGATPVVTNDGGERDVLGSGGFPASELDDLQDGIYSDGDEESDDLFGEAPVSTKRPGLSGETSDGVKKRAPFWVAADPINGFVPETMDFARMTEAADATQAPEAGTPGVAGGPDPNTAKLHASLRADHAAWAETPIDALKARGVSARVLNVLKKAEVTTVERALRCYPRKYQEFARWRDGMQNGTAVLAVGTVASYLKAPPSRRGWGHKTPSTLVLDVDDGAGGIAQFETKLWEYVPVDVERQLTPGSRACVRGVLSGVTARGARTLEKPALAMHVARRPDAECEVEVVPTYPKKHDVAPDKWPDIQRAAVAELRARLPADPMSVSLGLESSVLSELDLMSHADAMAHIHAPDSVERVCAARERLAFEELVLLQTSLLRERERAQNGGGEGVSVVSTQLCDEFRSVLDFSLTRGQENAMEEILHDMAGTKPMLRMLQGDVGCGKTVVAALAILAAVGNGHQGAFMAPTEVLAQQHARSLGAMLAKMSDPPKVALLTGSMTKKARDAALADIETGAAKVVVGTHSLISDDVVFHSLGIAVVDEQHRFGVEQRAALASKGPIGGYVDADDERAARSGADHAAALVAKENAAADLEDGDAADAAAWAAAAAEGADETREDETREGARVGSAPSAAPSAPSEKVPWRHAPHMLAMSATPIPRTLAMCKHGEMALSSIDEKPAGRLPIHTRLLEGRDAHEEAYAAMLREVESGGQCYIITPLVNTSTAESFERYKSAEDEFASLRDRYPDVRFGMLHGKMSSEEKQEGLRAFSEGKTQVLVATSVVEVGVDVPNASVIIVEDADRHGVSTLHQLRGRVGRGSRASACFLLVGDEAGFQAKDRLRVLEKTNNGFHVAESDLRLRGAGDLLGTRQSGAEASLFHASVQTDLFLLEAARRAAAETIARANVRGEGLPAPLAIALREKGEGLQDLTV